jgi:hypothetical protein
MSIDLTKLSEAELVELNRRIAERLQLIRSGQHLSDLTRFSVGMVVEFTTDDGHLMRGAISRLNREAATILSTAGSWQVPPSTLRVPEDRAAPIPANRRPD